jgi:hypothetical protein
MSTKKPSTKKPSTKKPSASTEEPSAPSAEKPSAAAEKPSAEKPSAEKPSAEKPSAEKRSWRHQVREAAKKEVEGKDRINVRRYVRDASGRIVPSAYLKKVLKKMNAEWKKQPRLEKPNPAVVHWATKEKVILSHAWENLQKKLAFRKEAREKKMDSKHRAKLAKARAKASRTENTLLREGPLNMSYLLYTACAQHIWEWLVAENEREPVPEEVASLMRMLINDFALHQAADRWRNLALKLMRTRYPERFGPDGHPIFEPKSKPKKKKGKKRGHGEDSGAEVGVAAKRSRFDENDLVDESLLL